jgi:hypothetical protein
MTNADASESRLALDFLDPLFAIAVHLSMAEGLMKTAMYECWLRVGYLSHDVWRSVNLFDLGVLFLGYCIVVTSWFGYHLSVARKPILLDTLAGKVRFVVDVLLLLDYCLILTRFSDFTFVLGAICAAFFLFILWDQAKRREYIRREYREDRDSARRRGVTALWFIMFLLLYLIDIVLLLPRSWALLVLGILFSFLYRLHKGQPKLIGEKFLCAPFPKYLPCAP